MTPTASRGRFVLPYAPPPPRIRAFARLPAGAVVLIAVLVPGLSSWLIRGRAGWIVFVTCWAVLAAAFACFGPLWGDVIFADADIRMREAGLWPFLATSAAVSVASAVLALGDRERALAGASPDQCMR